MPAGRHHFDRIARNIDGSDGQLDAGGGFERQVRDDVLTGGDAAENPPGVVAAKSAGRQLVAMLAAALARGTHAGADLHGLHRVDAHERVGDVRIQAVEHRFAEARRRAARNHRDARPDRIAGAADPPDQLLELGDARRVRTEERVVIRGRRIDRLDLEVPDLAQVAVDAHAEAPGEVAPRDRSGRYAHDRLARAGASAAAMIAQAVLLLVGVVGVSGTEAVAQLVVVARARVGILDDESDRRAGGAPLEHAREDAHLIGLAPLADEVRGAGAAAIDVRLQLRLGQWQSRRAAVDDAAHRRTVALAEGGDAE